MLCKKCGAEIPDDAVKCEYCGTDITPEAKKDKIYNENERNRKNQIDKMLEDKQSQLSEIKKRRDGKKAKQRRVKLAIILASCILAAAALGGGGYYVYNAFYGADPVLPSVSPVPTTRVITTAQPVSIAPIASVMPSAYPVTASPSSSGSSSSTGGSASGSTSSNGGSSSSGTSSASTSNKSSGGSSSSGSSSSSGNRTTASSATASSGGSSSASAASAKDSGITSNNISSQPAVGSEVINEDGRWLMTFTSGGVKYYAHVNPGATTDQVRNKNYTLTAEPTEETYNGNTVYEITSMTKYDGQGYILPNSGTKLLSKSDLSGLSKSDLALARNEIYARHGRRFTTPAYQRYFESKSWYSANPNYNYDDDNANLNATEIKNVQLIISCEK